MLKWIEKTVAVSDLKPFERNPRKITKQAYEKLKESLQKGGYHQRIVTTPELKVVGGYQRIRALSDLGIKEIPILIPDRDLTDDEFRRILVTDNLPFGDFDWDILSADYEVDELLDFGMPESWLDFMPKNDNEGLTEPNDVPPLSSVVVTVQGDQWRLDKHILRCGDSTNSDDVAALLGDVKPHLMVTDPPYGVDYKPEWRDNAGGKFGDGKIKMRGKVENDSRADWSEAFALFPGNIAYVWHSALHSKEVADSLTGLDFKLRAQIIWVKPHFIMSRGDYHWQHEPCWYAVKGTGSWKGDRKQTTVWEIAGMNPAGGSKETEDQHTNHSTQKPVECMKRPIENNSSPGQAVYEPFSGSGTTIIAGEMTGPAIFAMEISAEYVDMAIRRWQNFTGKDAIHIASGKTFNEMDKAKAA